MKKTKDVVLSLLLQNAAVFAAIMVFTVVLKVLPDTMVMEQQIIEGEETLPWLGRLVYMILSFVLSIGALFLSRKLGTWTGFFVANLGGILLWQSLGECAWHFGFAHMEGPQCGIWLFMTINLLAFACRRKVFDWNEWVFTLSFLVNWASHFLMEGTYPLAPAGMAAETWYKVAGFSSMAVIVVVVLAFRKRFNTTRENLIFSQLLFVGLSIAPGAMGVF